MGDKGLISYYLTNIQNPGAGRWVKENTVGAGEKEIVMIHAIVVQIGHELMSK